jgi:hypothetical protein
VKTTEESALVIYIPMVLDRHSKLDFLGVMRLGKRLNGQGYSSALRIIIQQLGKEVGKALYLAELHQKRYLRIEQRLVSIDQRLLKMVTDRPNLSGQSN